MNEPAFPITSPDGKDQFLGMTLRDYFVAHAPECPSWFMPAYEFDETRLAKWALSYADALLKERSK